MTKPYRLAVDFDGTIALGDSFPNAFNASPNIALITLLKELHDDYGCKIILWTCRENYGGKNYPDAEYLKDAVNFCEQYGLPLDAINQNIGEKDGEWGTLYGRKIMADIYIDDKSILGDPNWDGFISKLKIFVKTELTRRK